MKAPTATSPKSRSEQAAFRREQILDAALHLFAEQGFAATTTKQIAEQAGIREGLLYHYFPSKLGILNAVVTRRHTFVGEMLSSVEGAEGLPAGDVMRSVGDMLIQTFGREVELARIILGEAQVNAEVHAAFREMIDSVTGRLARYLERRIQAGELRADLSPHAAATGLLGGLMMFFLVHQRDDKDAWQKNARKFARTWIDTWYRGARA